MIYDIIGDIHGHASRLKGLLDLLGYTLTYHPSLAIDYYRPPEGHRAIFIGDLIDRGPEELETLQIVFAMLDADVADSVMGNHEYNALAFATINELGNSKNKLDNLKSNKTKSNNTILDNTKLDRPNTENKTYLRRHNTAHTRQHQAFLEEVPFGSEAHAYWLSRFYELPLWIETEHACFVHACWDDNKMAVLKPMLTKDNCLTPEALQQTGQVDSAAYEALERVLKGVEVPLPEGVRIADKEGTVRKRMRVRWWLKNLQSQRIVDIARASTSDLAQVPQDAIIDHVDFELKTDKPIFIGHYWLTGTPQPLSPQVVCTDYSVAGKGYLTAYQFDTENPMPLSADNFVQYIKD